MDSFTIKRSTRILNDGFVYVVTLPDDITRKQRDAISNEIDKLNEELYPDG